jgi:hypothetical protein
LDNHTWSKFHKPTPLAWTSISIQSHTSDKIVYDVFQKLWFLIQTMCSSLKFTQLSHMFHIQLHQAKVYHSSAHIYNKNGLTQLQKLQIVEQNFRINVIHLCVGWMNINYNHELWWYEVEISLISINVQNWVDICNYMPLNLFWIFIFAYKIWMSGATTQFTEFPKTKRNWIKLW